MVNFVARTRIVLALLAGAAVLAAAHSADRFSTADRALSAILSDTAVADAGDVMHAVASFRGLLLRETTHDPAEAAERVRGAFETVRMDLAQLEARHPDVIAEDPSALVAVLALDQTVAELAPLMAGVGDPAVRTKIADGAHSMAGSLGEVATAVSNASRQSVATAASERAEAYRRLLATVSVALLTCIVLAAVQAQANRQLDRLARRDALTGLPNRLTFSEALADVLEHPGPGNEVALMLIDVDLFKEINDTLGHGAGDQLLKEIARRLAPLASRDIRVARLGGDEFAVLITSHQAHRAAVDTVGRMMRGLSRSFEIGGKTIAISTSVGISITPLEWCDAETMLRNADTALYAAKGAGRGTYRIYHPRMDRAVRERRAMADDLRAALAARDLELHFQPIVDLATRQIVACEALTRWNRAGHGPVSPLTFISLAEEIGLIQDIGDWVLAEACRVARCWPDHVGVSINLSAHQFDGARLMATLARSLAESGIRPGRIELEITESLLLRDSAAVQTALKDLRLLGVQIALDDFGTGYSCLSYLQRFPIDRIKIDQSFVREMTQSPEATAIVESICLLAAKLGISTTGEGIETEAHAELLGGLGCRAGQGYLFARPMPAAAVTASFAGRGSVASAA